MKKFQKLSRAEMKNVLGGTGPVVNPCANGQSKYSCTKSGPCGSATTSECGTSQSDAETRVKNALQAQGSWGSDCYNSVTCTSSNPA